VACRQLEREGEAKEDHRNGQNADLEVDLEEIHKRLSDWCAKGGKRGRREGTQFCLSWEGLIGLLEGNVLYEV
jgi:hypothetical protein